VALEACTFDSARLWGSEENSLFGGLVSVGADIFRRIIVRVTRVALVQSGSLSLTNWTDTPVYEVCTNPAIYSADEKKATRRNT
jgi:hypothetical protein